MWEQTLPDAADPLRQGDLLRLQPMPRRGGMTLTANEITSTAKARLALVIEQCCNVENHHTVLLAKVDRVRRLDDDQPFMIALRNTDPTVGQMYAYNHYLLEELPEHLPYAENKLWTAYLLDRLSFAAQAGSEDLSEFQTRRVARMTIPARAQLRAKLALMLGRPEEVDAVWLADNQLDERGLPVL